VKVDTNLAAERPGEAAEAARAAEEIGFDGLWTAETKNDPFLALALAAAATDRIELGTSVAIAFARSPTVLAHTAWDLALLSKGRFVLGLGSQVKAHVERRFAMPWSAPVPRLREHVGLIRAVWENWQEGTPLDFRGEQYSASLMTPFFSPGPIEHPRPPIYIAGVGQPMLRLAGQVADGLCVHPFHTRRYLTEVILPAVDAGARRANRSRSDCTISIPAFVVTGRDEAERGRVREQTRARIAFYASTRSYEPVFALHGWGGVCQQLGRLAARGQWTEMPALIDDEMLTACAVDAEPADVGPALKERYGGLADRITFARRFEPGEDDRFWRETMNVLRS
jgi:probable F420-dependent oxidoreductase